MNIVARLNGVLTQVALWAGLGIFCLGVILTGTGFLIAGFYIWMSHVVAKSAAAAITGGGLFALAILALLIGGAVVKSMRKRQPSMAQEFRNTIGLGTRLITLMVARDPRKAVIVSLMAGALAEFITSERRK